MNQQWREEATTAVRGLLLWASLINIFVGVVLAWTMLNNGAPFWLYMLFLIPAVVGVWQYTKVGRLSDRWLINARMFYSQAIISFVLASWLSSIFLWLAGRRVTLIANNHQS